jgi:hypothetical protein
MTIVARSVAPGIREEAVLVLRRRERDDELDGEPADDAPLRELGAVSTAGGTGTASGTA